MRDILELDRYPLDRAACPEWSALVEKCRSDLVRDGMYNLEGFMRPSALDRAIAELRPVIDTLSFTHKRSHNIYFRKEMPGLAPDHPALQTTETKNHTVCADQIMQAVPHWIYEWAPFIKFVKAIILVPCMISDCPDPVPRYLRMNSRDIVGQLPDRF